MCSGGQNTSQIDRLGQQWEPSGMIVYISHGAEIGTIRFSVFAEYAVVYQTQCNN